MRIATLSSRADACARAFADRARIHDSDFGGARQHTARVAARAVAGVRRLSRQICGHQSAIRVALAALAVIRAAHVGPRLWSAQPGRRPAAIGESTGDLLFVPIFVTLFRRVDKRDDGLQALAGALILTFDCVVRLAHTGLSISKSARRHHNSADNPAGVQVFTSLRCPDGVRRVCCSCASRASNASRLHVPSWIGTCPARSVQCAVHCMQGRTGYVVLAALMLLFLYIAIPLARADRRADAGSGMVWRRLLWFGHVSRNAPIAPFPRMA